MTSDSPSATISCLACEPVSSLLCPPEALLATDSPYATITCEECEVYPVVEELLPGFWWQPSLDVWKGDDSIGIAARQWKDSTNLIRAYKGLIDGTGNITWSDQLLYSSSSTFTEPPLRLVSEALLHYTFNDTGVYPEPIRMYRRAGATSSDIEVFSAHEWQSEPGWEEFDMHTTGRVVVLSSTDDDGLKLRVSTDYGATFGAKIAIDYLYTLLGDEAYIYQYRYNAGYSIQVDEYTGTFYLLISWSDIDDWFYHWLILKSTDGATWSYVYEWDNSDYRYETDLCTLAVSNGNICVGLTWSADGSPVIYCSDDSGVSFTETTFSASYWGPSAAACQGTLFVMMPYFDPTAKHWHVYRTTNNGVTWTNNLQINSLGGNFLPGLICKGITYSGYRNIRASGDTVALTYCGGIYPNDEVEWVDPAGVHHNMAGVGETPRICFWLSRDNGLTWSLKLSPFTGWEWWA